MTNFRKSAEDLQAVLARAGLYPGKIDGALGPRTDAAYSALKAALAAPAVGNVWPSQGQMNAFYGNPDANGDGVVDPAWESANIVRIVPPYRMVLAWDTKSEVKSIRVHRKCSESLMRCLEAILNHYGSQEAVEAARMHLYGGCFNFRLKRGGSTLSNHSWGSAIDLDPERNAFGVKYDASKGMMPEAVVKIFQAEGWVWGGTWSKGDAMHFQAARM